MIFKFRLINLLEIIEVGYYFGLVEFKNSFLFLVDIRKTKFKLQEELAKLFYTNSLNPLFILGICWCKKYKYKYKYKYKPKDRFSHT